MSVLSGERCASCRADNPGYYDTHLDLSYCDDECMADYFDSRPELLIAYYKRYNITELSVIEIEPRDMIDWR